MDEINLGQYSAAVLISIVLALVFRLFKEGQLTDRAKILVTSGVGLAFGFVVFLYQGEAWTPKLIITYLANGFAAAAIASGLYTYAKKT